MIDRAHHSHTETEKKKKTRNKEIGINDFAALSSSQKRKNPSAIKLQNLQRDPSTMGLTGLPLNPAQINLRYHPGPCT